MFAFNFFFIFAPGHNLLALELRKGRSVIPSIFLHVFQVTKKIMVLIFAGDYLMHGKGSSLCFKKEIILVQFFRVFFCAMWHQQHGLIMCQFIFKPGFSALKGLCLFASSSNVFNVLKLSSMWKILIEFPVKRRRMGIQFGGKWLWLNNEQPWKQATPVVVIWRISWDHPCQLYTSCNECKCNIMQWGVKVKQNIFQWFLPMLDFFLPKLPLKALRAEIKL